jgi:hypothetical protein
MAYTLSIGCSAATFVCSKDVSASLGRYVASVVKIPRALTLKAFLLSLSLSLSLSVIEGFEIGSCVYIGRYCTTE